MEAFATGVVAGFGIAIPVGAIAVLIVEVSIRRGFRAGFFAGAGAASADFLYSALALAGGVAISQVVESVGREFRIVSGLVLGAIGIAGLIRARGRQTVDVNDSRPTPRQLSQIYLRFLALTMVNPATIIYFVAVIVGLGIGDEFSGVQAALFVGGAFLASLSWQTFLAGIGSFGGKRIGDRGRRVAMVVGNCIIVAIAVLILFQA